MLQRPLMTIRGCNKIWSIGNAVRIVTFQFIKYFRYDFSFQYIWYSYNQFTYCQFQNYFRCVFRDVILFDISTTNLIYKNKISKIYLNSINRTMKNYYSVAVTFYFILFNILRLLAKANKQTSQTNQTHAIWNTLEK